MFSVSAGTCRLRQLWREDQTNSDGVNIKCFRAFPSLPSLMDHPPDYIHSNLKGRSGGIRYGELKRPRCGRLISPTRWLWRQDRMTAFCQLDWILMRLKLSKKTGSIFQFKITLKSSLKFEKNNKIKKQQVQVMHVIRRRTHITGLHHLTARGSSATKPEEG